MSLKTVGIVGAGTMGPGIAMNVAENAFDVRLVDTTREQVDAALGKAAAYFDRKVERGRMQSPDAKTARARMKGSTDIADLAECDLVIEAIFERFDVKADLYKRLMPILSKDTLLATNTSCLRVTELAKEVDSPGRFLGMHYFNPPAVNPIVEVVRGEKTNPAVLATALAFCEATGKKTVACRDSYGFALNRFFCPYVNEAMRLYDDGTGSPFEIDRVASDVFGAAAGPFVVSNLVGSQVLLHAQENLMPLGDFYKPAESVVRVGSEGGSWEIGDPSAPDAARDKAIGDRLLGAAFLPVLQQLDEEVAEPNAIDMGAEAALKFGKPPCALMDSLGKSSVTALVAPFCEKYGAAQPASLSRVGKLIG